MRYFCIKFHDSFSPDVVAEEGARISDWEYIVLGVFLTHDTQIIHSRKNEQITKISKIQLPCLHIEMTFNIRKYALSNICKIFIKDD